MFLSALQRGVVCGASKCDFDTLRCPDARMQAADAQEHSVLARQFGAERAASRARLLQLGARVDTAAAKAAEVARH